MVVSIKRVDSRHETVREQNCFYEHRTPSRMDSEVPVDSLSLLERVVLVGLVDAAMAGETPADSAKIKARTVEYLDAVDTDIVARPSERDVIRALNRLGSEPYTTETQPETSPTGKGRPRYGVDADPGRILDGLADDDRLVDIDERIRR